MVTNRFTQRLLSRSLLLLLFLLPLMGIMIGCGNSSTTVPSHPTGTTTAINHEINGTISEFPLPTSHFSPSSIMLGPDDNLWFTEIASNECQRGMIGRITSAGKISEFSLPSEGVASGLLTGPDDNLWFSEADLDGWNNRIARITPTSTISELPVPEQISRAYGIITGADGNLWYIVELANHSQIDKIERITPAGKISVFSLPRPGVVPGNLAVGPDSKIWFTEMNNSKIGCLG